MPKSSLSKPERKFREYLLLGNLDQARALFAAGGVRLEAREKGFTVLHLECGLGRLESIRWLIDAGADVNARVSGDAAPDQRGQTPLMRAAGAFHARDKAIPVMRCLLDAGADRHAIDDSGRNALFHALEFPKNLEFLIACGLDLNVRDQQGCTSYMAALRHHHAKAAALLEKAGASQEGIPSIKLLEACAAGDSAEVKALLKAGAWVDFRFEATPLTCAAGAGHVEIVTLLLDAGADPSLPESDDSKGAFTPLSCAVYGGHLEVARLLLDHGADPTASNHGIRVLDYARLGKREGHHPDAPWDEIIALIRSALEKRKNSRSAAVPRLSTRLSEPALAFLATLPAKAIARITFSEVCGFDQIILESQELPGKELAKAWQALLQPARLGGWSCFAVTQSLDDIEPDIDDIKNDCREIAAETLKAWLGARMETVDDDGSKESGLQAREKALARLTEADLARYRKKIRRQPDFGPMAGESCRLVLMQGPPGRAAVFWRFGGWNDCPPPAIQAQMIDTWHSTHATELAMIGSDTLECWTTEPLDLASIRQAALEIACFCSETESAGEDIAIAADTLWGFWWD